MNPEIERYATALEESLVRAKMGPLERKAVLAMFHKEAKHTNPARALVEATEGYSNECGYLLLQMLAEKSKIEQGLERLSNEHPGIPLSPGERARREIAIFKKNVGKLECEIVLTEQDKARLAPHQLEAFEKAELQRRQPLDVEIPSCFFSQASYQGKQIRMELEVRK